MVKRYVRPAKWTYVPGMVFGIVILILDLGFMALSYLEGDFGWFDGNEFFQGLGGACLGISIFLLFFFLRRKNPVVQVIDDETTGCGARRSARHRLAEVEDLRKSCLINEMEYEEKRKQILDEV